MFSYARVLWTCEKFLLRLEFKINMLFDHEESVSPPAAHTLPCLLQPHWASTSQGMLTGRGCM